MLRSSTSALLARAPGVQTTTAVASVAATNNITLHQSLSSSAVSSPLLTEPLDRHERERLGAVPLYLDYQATTPVDPRVLDSMIPYYADQFGNPHSRTHSYGWETEAAVEQAREEVASLIGANAKEIVFTSGATESNNLAIKGVARFYAAQRKPRKHVITVATEHKCVLDSCRVLSLEGFDVTYLPVQPNGILDLDVLKAAIRPGETSIVSVMAVNNEIGVTQPIGDIGAVCREAGVFFHTDAAQAIGKVPVDVNAMNVDLMSMSGHKIYGPKGIGALYVRRRPRVRLTPLISGGGQERGMRSGTLPTPLVVGFGKACAIAEEDLEADSAHVARLFDRLYTGLSSQLDDIVVNGDLDQRYKGNLNISFSCVEGESLVMALHNVAVSSGSACTSTSLEPSYVLRALGVEEDMAHTSIRFGIGRFTTEREIDYVTALTVKYVNKLRDMSPLWDMKQAGIDLSTIQWSEV